MKTAKKQKQIGKFDVELINQLDEICNRIGRTRKSVLRSLIDDFIEGKKYTSLGEAQSLLAERIKKLEQWKREQEEKT